MGLLLSFTLAMLLALIHLQAYRLTTISSIPRSIWLSFGGGISVAYVFLQILPELHQGQMLIEETGIFPFAQHHIFVFSLMGLISFYGLENLVLKSKKAPVDNNPMFFWLHLGSFALYNLMLGYILYFKNEQSGLRMTYFFIALSAHFLVNDFGLQQHYKKLYVEKGRWFLAISIVLGWTIGHLLKVSEVSLMLIMAFLSGGIILNALKEELPEERSSRFWAFLSGAIAYSLALLMV